MRPWRKTCTLQTNLRLSSIWYRHPLRKLYDALSLSPPSFRCGLCDSAIYVPPYPWLAPFFQAACLIRVPTEVIKTRMQTSTYGALGASSFASARLVLANDGLRGFYRGFGITVMREVSIPLSILSCRFSDHHCEDTIHVIAIPSLWTLEIATFWQSWSETVICARSSYMREYSWRFRCGVDHTSGCSQNTRYARHSGRLDVISALTFLLSQLLSIF